MNYPRFSWMSYDLADYFVLFSTYFHTDFFLNCQIPIIQLDNFWAT